MITEVKIGSILDMKFGGKNRDHVQLVSNENVLKVSKHLFLALNKMQVILKNTGNDRFSGKTVRGFCSTKAVVSTKTVVACIEFL